MELGRCKWITLSSTKSVLRICTPFRRKGNPYKCFQRLPKENSQIRMAENGEEKTGFHTEEGVYYFTHMPKGSKNSAATLQRMMEKVLADQKGRNVEVYLEEIVVKSKSEQSLVQDIEETLRKLKRVNIKIDPNTSSFRVEEGRFLGHMVTKEGVRADPEKVQTIIRSPTSQKV
ncbi:reverse transcriptase domain-containing protein [Tanacetum coccineum]